MKYTVEVNVNRTIRWFKEGTEILHREDGPAVDYVNGLKEWFINGKKIDCKNQEEFEEIIKKEFSIKTDSCTGKIINIDGKNYKLVPVE